ncbi:STAS domain-containing protein [Natronosporangium hydrolyticum]|uniref:STAS domain-containing protein n=1 Tax=Natronosporangium hydrolyticum TaxID=2811111 RepID=A0A895YN71_9ACTN|nr:STAS domain-containing protein [Natronosporangium hydrolyticum]QSB15560.1 STAS domain-containing protein [Natronosporangium hydrolyticum]
MAEGTIAEPLRITVQPTAGGAVRLAVFGVVDLATAPQLRTTVLAHIHAPRRPTGVELDLEAATFMDAVGVRALLDGHRAAAQSRLAYTIHNPRGMVAHILTLSGVTEVLSIVG